VTTPERSPTKAPRLDFTAPRVDDADPTVLAARSERVGERFADTDLGGYDLTGSTFDECEFASMSLSETQLRGSRFIASLLTAPFAPVLLAARTVWRDTRIEMPRWGSAQLFESTFTSVHIRGGKIDFLNLRGASLTDVLIEDCTITDLDLGVVTATRIALKNCRIGTLDLTRAMSMDVDLRSSEFAAVNGLEGLAGATIDDYQLSLFAPLLAAQLGIIVE
jgi:uncharacterized protein YjbI with pentapeptide repeats